MCVCVCVCERERENVCVCVCVLNRMCHLGVKYISTLLANTPKHELTKPTGANIFHNTVVVQV